MAWLKIIHIVGIVFWMGTLLIVTRVQAWSTGQTPEVRDSVKGLTSRLMMGGALPGAILVIGAGLMMLAKYDWSPLNASEVGPRFHIKLTFVFLLMVLSGIINGADTAKKARGFFGMLHGVTASLFLGTVAVFYLMVRT